MKPSPGGEDEIRATLEEASAFCCAAAPLRSSQLQTNYSVAVMQLTEAIKAEELLGFYVFKKNRKSHWFLLARMNCLVLLRAASARHCLWPGGGAPLQAAESTATRGHNAARLPVEINLTQAFAKINCVNEKRWDKQSDKLIISMSDASEATNQSGLR